MTTVFLISAVAIVVAIVGCAVIWRMDMLRADEVEHIARPEPSPRMLGGEPREHPRPIGS